MINQNTPWESHKINPFDVVIIDKDGKEIIQMLDSDSVGVILKAVNNHDTLIAELKDAKRMLGQIRRSMSAHPDHTEGSEFDDMTTGAQIIENRIEGILDGLKGEG